MTKRELLRLLLSEHYSVDIHAGTIRNQKGNLLKAYPNEEGHLFVRLYKDGKRKASAVHRLVWMYATRSTIPKEFEIHHRDRDTSNNAFENLLCVHRLDHIKFHVSEEEVPF